VYSIDGLEILFPGPEIIPYILVESDHDLTLLGTCSLRELPKHERNLNNIEYEMKDIKRIVLSQTYPSTNQ
jgi:hypothetical protein